ncbi:hypothetical protein EC844_12265 [Acinetobacter calcoaceticus]|uniref:Uncharacterized protein n=1 Tax=Acinetobacter calcoaceticus TaxID=471 RepID=A0A4R1XIS5_ACICA|nr:hypothetical protein EC844_12265 [Acinetobacter calcoaceticus]
MKHQQLSLVNQLAQSRFVSLSSTGSNFPALGLSQYHDLEHTFECLSV